MGALVSLAAAPLSMAATCCGSILGSCAATAVCKACTCYCVVPGKVASFLYVAIFLIFLVFGEMRLNAGGTPEGDIVWFNKGPGNATAEESMISKMTGAGAAQAFDWWNSRTPCSDAHMLDGHTDGIIICCANQCSGVYSVYRLSFVLTLFFAFHMCVYYPPSPSRHPPLFFLVSSL